MAGAVCRQFFVQSADCGDFSHIGIHFLIARDGKQPSALLAVRIESVFLQDGERQPKQRNNAHHRDLLARLAEPCIALLVDGDVFGSQLLDIGERQPGQTTKDEDIPHIFEAQIRHRFGDERFYLPFRQMLFRWRGDLFELVALKRIFFRSIRCVGNKG